jgi:hypothetical protein
MAENRNKRIWNNAIQLSDAWLHFATPQQQAQLANLPTGLQELESRKAEVSGFLKMLEASQAGWLAHQKRLEMIEQLKEQLLDELFNSNVSAFGYRLTPSESRGPVQIDPVFFEYPEIDWDGNSAEFNGKSYRAISIIDPYNLPNADKLKTGRPSSGNVINAAIKELILNNPQFCNQHRAAACQQIRKSIGKPEIPGSGLSDKNLEKYIIANCGRRQIIK